MIYFIRIMEYHGFRGIIGKFIRDHFALAEDV